MTDLLRLPFEERKKNAPNIEFLVERMLSVKSSSNSSSMSLSFGLSSQGNLLNFTPTNRCKIVNNFSNINQETKKNKKFVTTIAKKINFENLTNINQPKNNSTTIEMLNDRNENIKGVLHSIIQMKNKKNVQLGQIEDKINKIHFGFEDDDLNPPNKTIKKRISSNLINRNLLLFEKDFGKIDNKTISDINCNRDDDGKTSLIDNLASQQESQSIENLFIHKSHTNILERLRRNKKQLVQKKQTIKEENLSSNRSSLSLIDSNRSKILSSSSNNLLKTSDNKLLEKDETLNEDHSLNQNSSSQNKINTTHQPLILLEQATELSAISNVQDKEKAFIEKKFRLLDKRNYQVYDSLSDNEDVKDIIDNSFKIMPNSLFITIWENILSLIFLYFSFIVPVLITFPKDIPNYIKALEVIIDLYFIADIIINFFIPFPIENSSLFDYEYSQHKIVVHYLCTWFLFDFIMAFPFNTLINFSLDYIGGPLDSFLHIKHYWNMFKLAKLLILVKSVINQKRHKKYQRSIIDDYIGVNAKRLFQFVFFLFTLTHISSCIWALIGKIEYPNWIIQYNLIDKSSTEIYFASMYYNFATIFSIGYGDICTTNKHERLYNIMLQSAGLFLYSYILSSMSYLLKIEKEKEEVLERKLAILEGIKMQYNIDIYLFWKIKKYLLYQSEKDQESEISFLQSLPNNLKNEMISKMYKDVLSFKFFKNTNFEFKNKVIMNLKPIQAEMNNILIGMNTLVDDLILIKRGILGIEYQYKGAIIKISKLRRGEHFGEVNMLLHKKCPFDIIVKTKKADLYYLNKTALIELGNEFPDIFEKLKKKSLINYSLFKQKLKKEIAEVDLKLINLRTHTICTLSRNGSNKKTFAQDNDDIYNYGDYSNDEEGYNYVFPQQIETIQEESDDDNDSNSKEEKNNPPVIIKQEPQVKATTIKNLNLRASKISSLSYDPHRSKSQSKSKSGVKSESFISAPKPMNFFSKTSFNNNIHNTTITPKKALKSTISTKSLNFKDLHSIRNEEIKKIPGNRKYSCNQLKIGEPLKLGMKSSKSLLSSKNVSKFQKNSDKINKNIREGSMSINEPTVFYENIFDKWALNDQIKRINTIYHKILSSYSKTS